MSNAGRPTSLPWWVELLLTGLIGLATMIYVQAVHDDKDLTSRVATVEAVQKGQAEVDHLRDKKVDHIQEQVDKLVEWALGHK